MTAAKPSILFLLIFSLAATIFLSNLAAASDSLGLSVRPAKLEIEARPGIQETKTITVANISDQELTVNVSVRDFKISVDNVLNYYPPGNISYSCARWAETDQKVFTLAPHQSQDVKLTLSVPKNVEPGGHYASATFTSAKKPAAGEVKVSTAVRIGVLILATADGPLVRKGRIVSLLAFRESFSQWTKSFARVAQTNGLIRASKTDLAKPVLLRGLFENTGNVHLNIKGKLQISDSAGKTVFQQPVPAYTVLPRTKRYLDFRWKKPPLAGKFSSRLIIRYDNGKSQVKEHHFYIFSWLIVVLAVSVVVSALVAFLAVKILRLKRLRIQTMRAKPRSYD